ncbi:Uncharacterised protein [Mycobacteroides abscessus]|nr:Uncharacterised protein [Mycobacteroides abscessus]
MVSPSTTPESTRTPGPDGKRRRVMRPGAGRKLAAGSSPLMRNSIEWPRTCVEVYPSGSPAAMRSCSRTRSMPVTSSETGCSTCRRVLTSRKEMVPSAPTRNSHVPAPTYPASRRIASDALYSSASCAALRNGAGASSTSFWWRRWSEQSRVDTTTTVPCSSARHWVSTCRGVSRYRSTKHSPRPNAAVASRTADS